MLDTIPQVFENELVRDHKIMVPPHISGEIVKIYDTSPGEELTLDDPLMEVLDQRSGQVSVTHTLSISQLNERQGRVGIERVFIQKRES